ncbi:MAG: hypothetical protein KKA73_19205 [Chloroflexi bacterium]|nr:hypothetical protein [Chloroflexota bacterium]MBU1749817.1 hypothetical protein [Chloroflexota bacterium]MBU1880209.1 hypothetical protein [Chloroflexota bacterium]
MNRRTALLTVAVLVLAASACQPGIQETGPGGTGWLTYTNTKMGYQVNYNPDWTYSEFPDRGTGASFSPKDTPADTKHILITVDATIPPEQYNGQSIAGMSFEDYVRIAAMAEIQGFEKLISIDKVTANGVTGYVTTWEYQQIIAPGQAQTQTSMPIAYFELNRTVDGRTYRALQISLQDANYQADFDHLVRSVTLTGQ